MNEQEFVQIQLEWLKEQFKTAHLESEREAIIRAIVDITTSAMVEDTFPGFKTDKDLPA